MATSGSVDFTQTRNEIIADALVHLNVLDAGEDADSVDDTFAARQLNRMLKTWMIDGIHLWTRQEAYLFTQKSQASYTLGPSGSAKATLVSETVSTTLAADESSGDGTVKLSSVTGISTSDNIGVVLDDDTIEWFTVSSISSPDVTLSGSLGGDASSGNPVFAYTDKIGKPLRVIDAQRRSKDDIDTPIIMVSHEEYQRLPNKTDTGKTNQVYYHPLRDTGSVYLWPEPETAADRIRMTCQFAIEDMDSTVDNLDLPQEWLDTAVWNLALKLAPSYGVGGEMYKQIRDEAQRLYQGLLMWDQQPESLYFQPAMDHRHGG